MNMTRKEKIEMAIKNIVSQGNRVDDLGNAPAEFGNVLPVGWLDNTIYEKAIKYNLTDGYDSQKIITSNICEGALEATWVNEGFNIPESKAVFRSKTIKPGKIAVSVPTTGEIDQDVPYLQSFLRKKLPQAISRVVNKGMIYGSTGEIDGASMIGVKQSDVIYITPETNIVDQVKDMYDKIVTSDNLVWAFSKSAWNDLVGSGYALIQFDREDKYLLGIPVHVVDYLVDGEFILGDFDYYAIAQKELKQDLSEHVYFDSDQNVLKTTLRIGGDVSLSAPISCSTYESASAGSLALSADMDIYDYNTEVYVDTTLVDQEYRLQQWATFDISSLSDVDVNDMTVILSDLSGNDVTFYPDGDNLVADKYNLTGKIDGDTLKVRYKTWDPSTVDARSSRFSDNGDGTITDEFGLMWIADPAETTNYPGISSSYPDAFDGIMLSEEGAVEYVTEINAASGLGYNDWRLPTGTLDAVNDPNSAEVDTLWRFLKSDTEDAPFVNNFDIFKIFNLGMQESLWADVILGPTANALGRTPRRGVKPINRFVENEIEGTTLLFHDQGYSNTLLVRDITPPSQVLDLDSTATIKYQDEVIAVKYPFASNS